MASDWSGLSRLIVDTFDAPDADASALRQARWRLFEKDATEMATYQRYVKMAKKMKGLKYSLLLAKEAGEGVVGMVELGLNGGLDGDARRPTIGLICVAQEHRHKGIGEDLVKRCEKIVSEVWNDGMLYAEVEESNERALLFFQSLGFEAKDDETVMVNLRRGLQIEERPHILMSRELASAKTAVGSQLDSSSEES